MGGNQTAADGGLDVRVALPSDVLIDGFIPRIETGFQVKKPDMNRAEIIKEMRPKGQIRPVIQSLIEANGAYIIVCSKGSTSDSVLQNRKAALREALSGSINSHQLYTDFYDNRRLVTWVRCHPAVFIWVKERIGRSITGWRPFGPWSRSSDTSEDEYVLDETLKLDLGSHQIGASKSATELIDALRDTLAQERKSVRLVGLAGVGKTRFLQALFDTRVGTRSLHPSLAVYSNLSDSPNPPPLGMASNMIASGMRAILIVDNCPSDLHRRLADVCSMRDSLLTIVTVEYDIREDQPEDTQVVTLDTNSSKVIEVIIKRRYPKISHVNVQSIANACGGNARIALALAGTVDRSDSITGLSDAELFDRLFYQRYERSPSLLTAAQACSLVYSFQSLATTGSESEMPILAELAGQTSHEIHQHLSALKRRDLVQERGVWCAVLPHAIANHLAARALENFSHELIDRLLITGGTERLKKSFSRRLSYLHDHHSAVGLVRKWLSYGGLLSNLRSFDSISREMFKNVSPVLPESALSTLERADDADSEFVSGMWRPYINLIRSLSFDVALFDRAANLLSNIVSLSTDEWEVKEATSAYESLFSLYLSGTHASSKQRLQQIERLLSSNEPRRKSLGLSALGHLMRTTQYASHYHFDFGARSRDYGYYPQTECEISEWYVGAISLVDKLIINITTLDTDLHALVARRFQGLWNSGLVYDELEALCKHIATARFWPEGWLACRHTLKYQATRLEHDDTRLKTLLISLKPSTLEDKIRSVVLARAPGEFGLEDYGFEDSLDNELNSLDSVAKKLGESVAKNSNLLLKILPDLFYEGSRLHIFGCGLARGSSDPLETWSILLEGLKKTSPENTNINMLIGYIAELATNNYGKVDALLDAILIDPSVNIFFPLLQSALDLDQKCLDRLMLSLQTGLTPLHSYKYLSYGKTTDHLSGSDLKDLIILIADQLNGFGLAVEILYGRLFSDVSLHKDHEPELLEVGRELLSRFAFEGGNHRGNYELVGIIKSSLTEPSGRIIATKLVSKLRDAVKSYQTRASSYLDILNALLNLQPVAVLDTLFTGDQSLTLSGVHLFEPILDLNENPADSISSDNLLAWCNVDPNTRYLTASSFITFANKANELNSIVWSEHAVALLDHAPNPKDVLEIFISRFRPSFWQGSLASIIEMNAGLLERIDTNKLKETKLLISDAKISLKKQIKELRSSEEKSSRRSDERFE